MVAVGIFNGWVGLDSPRGERMFGKIVEQLFDVSPRSRPNGLGGARNMSDALREATHYLMDRWLDDSEAKISFTEIRAHLEENGSASRDERLDAEIERLMMIVLNRCDGIEVGTREVRVKGGQPSQLRKLFQNLDDIVDGMARPHHPLLPETRPTTSHDLTTGRTSVLDELDAELAFQRSKPARGRS